MATRAQAAGARGVGALRALLAAGADASASDAMGRGPLAVACVFNDGEVRWGGPGAPGPAAAVGGVWYSYGSAMPSRRVY